MTTCPHCHSPKIVKNGKSYHSKQNYKCRHCRRQAVEREPERLFSRDELLRGLLLERLSLRAIARLLKVSVGWLVPRVKALWQGAAERLPQGRLEETEVGLLCVEADEQWGFVGAKDCPVWLWLAMERRTGLVVGFHLGERDTEGAMGLWLSIPQKLREKALVFTDGLEAYGAVFAKGQHQPEGKRETTKMERLNNTLRQRCARLVRKTLSFSRSWENHRLAIRYFLYSYNLEKLAKMPSLL
ncbi:IS1 family transposase [Rufibacter sp. XAAS-G3-1]|uniref:IS1 family transposase n=1 Tax=Rufibacter sp. XAAS-G3-1 TaxID=2729134 RepID=UPI0015E70EF1|nr:IS1 family transposase [Rufibacter sp. XAAS-G3-1]